MDFYKESMSCLFITDSYEFRKPVEVGLKIS